MNAERIRLDTGLGMGALLALALLVGLSAVFAVGKGPTGQDAPTSHSGPLEFAVEPSVAPADEPPQAGSGPSGDPAPRVAGPAGGNGPDRAPGMPRERAEAVARLEARVEVRAHGTVSQPI